MMMINQERRLAAILIADVVGYSRLMSEQEETTLINLTDRLQLFERTIKNHGGRVFGSAGDSVIAEFPSPVEAVRCSVVVQRNLQQKNDKIPEDKRMQFRIGINLGDVIVKNDNLYGDGVNVAARLETMANPGGICISGSVYDQVEGKLSLEFEYLGEQNVKNISRPLRTYNIRLKQVEPTVASPVINRREWSIWLGSAVLIGITIIGAIHWFRFGFNSNETLEAPSVVNRTFIAVLPFRNLSGNPEKEYFSDGLTEDIIAALGRFSSLSVIGREGSFQYKNKSVDPRKIGRDLGVNYLLSGSIRGDQDKLQVSASLIDAARGILLWSERFSENIEDLFILQKNITRRVVGSLAIKVNQIERQRAFTKTTSNLEAYDYLLRGSHFFYKSTRTDNIKAAEYFQKALELDKNYALAYAMLGWTQYESVASGWTQFAGESLSLAEEFAQKGLNLDKENSECHKLLGLVNLHHRNYEKGIKELHKALDINPSDPESYAILGSIFAWAGRSDEAIKGIKSAFRLSSNPRYRSYQHLGLAYYLKGEYEAAIETLIDRPADQYQKFIPFAILAASYGQLDKVDEASVAAQNVLRYFPFFRTNDFVSQLSRQKDRTHMAQGLQKAGLK